MKVLNYNGLPVAPISEFKILQGDLKFLDGENYNKLKKNIEKHGFSIPVYCWIDDNGQKWLLDGTQRKHVLETEGWNEPIPYLVVKAPNMATAAERLLEITSQYGTITQEGLDEYIAKFELPDMEIASLTNFDGVFNFSIEDPLDEPGPEPETDEETDEGYEEEVAIRLEIRFVDGQYHAKSIVNKKSDSLGAFDTVAQLKNSVAGAIDAWAN